MCTRCPPSYANFLMGYLDEKLYEKVEKNFRSGLQRQEKTPKTTSTIVITNHSRLFTKNIKYLLGVKRLPEASDVFGLVNLS
ncbi:Hypothetical predicted protein [Octopus vulgaris]|uniref:Uncharacterized protein n=1 Tax=Octopus vulgaris TaxID=6645 RepID=A0AA36FCV1_OCTVU|nr:Hypothetical predicted protein [Octopus vulgaris]